MRSLALAAAATEETEQPPFILLDHNVQASVPEKLKGSARFRQVSEAGGRRARRFRADAKDHQIYQGQRRFLFVTHDHDFLEPDRVPHQHGGILVFTCAEDQLAAALKRFLDWWGPKRNLLRDRVFKLTTTGGVEVLRDGSYRKIYRQPSGTEGGSY